MKVRIYNQEDIPNNVVYEVLWYTTGLYGLRDVAMEITDGLIVKQIRVQFENIDWLEE
jgi:hypothetical protein